MSTLTERLLKASSLANVALIDESKVFGTKSKTRTPIPAMNVALSGEVDVGFSSGITTFAGESKMFKTAYSLVMAKGFQDTHKDGIVILFDSEFGSPPDYLKSSGIDTSRVLHFPVTNLEEFKFEIMNILEETKRSDNVFILLDSLGNLASKKEVADAIEGKSVADMTRAKVIKSIFRIITPILSINDIPMCVINHCYDETGLFAKKIMGGGQGIMLSSDTVFFITKRQEKVGTEIEGYTFTLSIEKSRFVREKAKIPITVKFNGGIDVCSSLVEWGLESGHITKPSNGWYQFKDTEQKLRFKDINNTKLLAPMLADEAFKEWVTNRYKLSGSGKGLFQKTFNEDEEG